MRLMKVLAADFFAWLGEKARELSIAIGGRAVEPAGCKYCLDVMPMRMATMGHTDGGDRQVFDILCAVATAGKRCPKASELPAKDSGATSRLARAGFIRIEIYAENWRVVEIRKGPSAGLRTKAFRLPTSKPYRVIDENGDVYTRIVREQQASR